MNVYTRVRRCITFDAIAVLVGRAEVSVHVPRLHGEALLPTVRTPNCGEVFWSVLELEEKKSYPNPYFWSVESDQNTADP
mgnify:CR=1 FL=1